VVIGIPSFWANRRTDEKALGAGSDSMLEIGRVFGM
jgi:hypothetical protein